MFKKTALLTAIAGLALAAGSADAATIVYAFEGGAETGQILSIAATSNDFHCQLMSMSTTRYGVNLTPGEATFTVRCLRYNNPFGTRSGNKIEDAYEASMSFDALAGHVYKIDIDEKNPTCILLIDVSREPQDIVCAPSTRLEDLIGRKRSDVFG